MARSVTRPRARAVIATLALALLMQLTATMPARAADVLDTIAPTVPANFQVVSRTKGGLITLGWDASSDAVGVAGYSLYRNGAWSGTLYQAGVELTGTVMYDRLNGRTKTTVTYQLKAFDAAGNVSAPATLVVTP